MSYTPEPGHVVTFANTYDSRSLYHVDDVGANRVTVSPLEQPDGCTASLNISLPVFRDMGATPLVLSDEEMESMEIRYASRLMEAIEFVEMAMIVRDIFGKEMGELIVPMSEVRTLQADIDRFGKGIKFLKDARENARETADTADGR